MNKKTKYISSDFENLQDTKGNLPPFSLTASCHHQLMAQNEQATKRDMIFNLIKKNQLISFNHDHSMQIKPNHILG